VALSAKQVVKEVIVLTVCVGLRSEVEEKKKATSLPANRNGVTRGINGKASGNGKSR
jgi:hypothetical protein